MKGASLGCARCGDCCDPVHLRPENVEALEDASATSDPESTAFAAEHWRRRGAPDEDGWVAYDCDQFDPDTRLCTAGAARPPVCKYYPWYLGEPVARRAAGLHPWCSYLLDVPASDRPEGSYPLIPVEVIRG